MDIKMYSDKYSKSTHKIKVLLLYKNLKSWTGASTKMIVPLALIIVQESMQINGTKINMF